MKLDGISDQNLTLDKWEESGNDSKALVLWVYFYKPVQKFEVRNIFFHVFKVLYAY